MNPELKELTVYIQIDAEDQERFQKVTEIAVGAGFTFTAEKGQGDTGQVIDIVLSAGKSSHPPVVLWNALGVMARAGGFENARALLAAYGMGKSLDQAQE